MHADAVPLFRRAQQALLGGDHRAAANLLDEALRRSPEHPEVQRLRAIAMQVQGQIDNAIALLRDAARAWPEDGLIASNLGAAHAQGGDLAAALPAFERAVALDPSLLDAWLNLARARDLRSDAAGAYTAYSAVLKLDSARAPVRILRAKTLETLGRLDEAESDLRSALRDLGDPARPQGPREHANAASAWIALFNLKALRTDGIDGAALARLRANPAITPAQRIGLGFAQASLLESEGRYAEAFALFEETNAARRRSVDWDAAAASALVDAIGAAFAQAPPAQSGGPPDVVFLVGMPRSGSTLAEQILAAHPRVSGGGETNAVARVLEQESRRRGQRFPAWAVEASAQDWARLGADYRACIAPLRGAGALFTDKTLPNWQVLGAIARMLPTARFVHCLRNPLETCWSCYKHHFGTAQYFTYDLGELAAFYRDCTRAMHAWAAQMPERIHAQVYEDLVAQPDASVRALLAHCGLDFDAACLRFHEVRREVRTTSAAQVRRPLRADTAVAARYGNLLDPLRRALA